MHKIGSFSPHAATFAKIETAAAPTAVRRAYRSEGH